MKRNGLVQKGAKQLRTNEQLEYQAIRSHQLSAKRADLRPDAGPTVSLPPHPRGFPGAEPGDTGTCSQGSMDHAFDSS